MTAASCVHKAVRYLAHDHRPFAPARLAGRDQRRDDRYPSDVTDEEWELIVPATLIPFGVAKSATDRWSTEPGRRECRYRCRHGTSVEKYGGGAYLLIGRVYDIPPGMMQIGRTGVVPFIRWQTWQRPSGEVRCDDHKKIGPFQK
jgi:hypothetical protein